MQHRNGRSYHSSEVNLVGRSRADRLLDSDYYRQKRHIQTLQSAQQNAKGFEKRRSIATATKTDTIPSVKTPSSTPPLKSVTEAVDDIVHKHLPYKNKFSKSVRLFNNLLTGKYMNLETKPLFLHAIYSIILSEHATSSVEARQEVFKLFDQCLSVYEKNENEQQMTKAVHSLQPVIAVNEQTEVIDNPNEYVANNSSEASASQALDVEDSIVDQITTPKSYFFDSDERKFLEVLRIRGILHIKLFTDDTYQFNDAVNNLKIVFSEICKVKGPLSKAEASVEMLGGVNDDLCEQQSSHDPIHSKTVDSNDSFHSISASDASSVNTCSAKESTVIPADVPSWTLPKADELLKLKICLFFGTLSTIFSYRHFQWARSAVEALFQHIYFKRNIFSVEQQAQITDWQSLLKTKAKELQSINALSIGEAANPVKDGREERISTIHGSAVWSAKQTGL